jgi:hypothetical protein
MPWQEIGDKMRIGYDASTGERGVQMKRENRSGAASVKGTLITASDTNDNAWDILTANIPKPDGVVYEGGVANGSECWCWDDGSIAQCLLEDSSPCTHGYWAKVSDTQDGRVDASNASPPGGTIVAIEDHLSEVGHCQQSQTAGTDKLALMKLHFN